jgi:hypothetical protein
MGTLKMTASMEREYLLPKKEYRSQAFGKKMYLCKLMLKFFLNIDNLKSYFLFI